MASRSYVCCDVVTLEYTSSFFEDSGAAYLLFVVLICVRELACVETGGWPSRSEALLGVALQTDRPLRHHIVVEIGYCGVPVITFDTIGEYLLP